MDKIASDNIEKLYKNYEILSDAKDKISEHEKEYKEILDAVKGSAKEKRLASQFIGKFFKHFPKLAETAIDAQLDLCEDEDVQIRRQGIKDLPQLCKDNKDHSPKIGDILAQFLITEDAAELQIVHLSLQTMAKYDIKGMLTGIFNQIMTGDETTRDRCFRFLMNKFKNFGSEIVTKEIEEYLINELKKILQDVTADEFHLCMTILGSTKLGSTVTGHAELVSLAVEQAELGADIDAVTLDDEVVERFIQCATHAIPYFSVRTNQVESTPFVKFLCEKLLPLNTWNLIAATEQEQMQLRLLKVFAEMCSSCGLLEKAGEKIEAIFIVLLEYMPLPPLDADIMNDTPSFQFSHAECLLYALHTIGKQCPEYLTFPNDPAKLKDFRSRLQYLARGTQGYIKKLQEAVKGVSPEDLKTDENKIKVTALKTTSNIGILIRDLFHTPPSFKSMIQLSWVTKKIDKSPTKRHAPITFGAANGKSEDTKGSKQSRNNLESSQRVYTPPSGKYSGKVSNYSNSNNKNGGGGGGGYGGRQGNRSRNGGGGGGGGGGFRGGNRNRNFRRY